MVRGLRPFVVLLALMSVAALGPVSEAERASVSGSAPEVECVCMVDSYYSASGETAGSYGLQMFSNGSAFVWYAAYDLPDDQLAADYNESHWEDFGTEAFGEVVACMEAEGFWAMEESYADANAAVLYPPTIELGASGPSSNKSVVFEGFAMAGLMPDTYLLLSMEGWDEVCVEVTVEEASPFTFEVSCVLSNGGDTDITVAGVCEDFWHIVVVRENGCTFEPMDTNMVSCVKTVGPGEQAAFEPKMLNASGYPDGEYVILAPMAPFVGIGTFTVEGNDAYVNTPPFDHGNVILRESDSSNTVTIQLVRCCDAEDRLEDILVRWDWESDGVWDTSWSQEKSVTRTFEDPDHLNVTYELKDSEGAVTTGAATLTVERDDTVVLGLTVPGLAAVVAVAVCAVVVLALVLMRARGKPGRGT